MADAHSIPASRLAALLGPSGPELSCEECFEVIDHYVDLELAGADADAALPRLRAHLHGCPACMDDHASLIAYVRRKTSKT